MGGTSCLGVLTRTVRRVLGDFSLWEVLINLVAQRMGADSLFPQSGLDSPWRGKEGEKGLGPVLESSGLSLY